MSSMTKDRISSFMNPFADSPSHLAQCLKTGKENRVLSREQTCSKKTHNHTWRISFSKWQYNCHFDFMGFTKFLIKIFLFLGYWIAESGGTERKWLTSLAYRKCIAKPQSSHSSLSLIILCPPIVSVPQPQTTTHEWRVGHTKSGVLVNVNEFMDISWLQNTKTKNFFKTH